MALAALIPACRVVEESGRLRATLPLGGRTLIERQALLAAKAGAERIVVLVERMPAALIAAIDRLRRDGVPVELARGLADAVGHIHPEDALLLIADGLVAPRRLVAKVAKSRWHLILTVPDDSAHQRFERIDATVRWAGLLLVDGLRLRQVAEMLGEWDLESTLLRSAVQANAERIGAEERAPAEVLVIAEEEGELVPLDRAIFATEAAAGADVPGRWLYPFVERLALPLLLRRGADPAWLGIGATGAAWFGALLMLARWPLAALLLLLLSGPLASMAKRLASARLAKVRQGPLLGRARIVGMAAALAVLAWVLTPGFGWGIWALAATVAAFLVATERERMLLGRAGAPATIWVASPDALVWLLLPFALGGEWRVGLAVLCLYGAASLGVLQHALGQALARSASED